MEDLFIVLLKPAFMCAHGHRFERSFQAVFDWDRVDGGAWGWKAPPNGEGKFISTNGKPLSDASLK